MPHTLTLTYQPVLHIHAPRHPTWRQLLAIADHAVPRLSTLWRGLLVDVRNALRQRSLETALGVHLLEARSVIAQRWEQLVEQPARRLLGAIADEVMQEAEEESRRGLRGGLAVLPDATARQQVLDAYIGTQIRDITRTSLRTAQHVLREGMQTGDSAPVIARELRQVIGLTPQQYRAVQTMRVRLESEGRSPGEITRLLGQAIRQGLQRRAQTIAQYQGASLAQLGAHQALTAAVAAGAVDAERLRRFWIVVPGACAEHCSPIPGMNPGGVGLNEAFQTPDGPMLFPPMHPWCRCSTAARV